MMVSNITPNDSSVALLCINCSVLDLAVDITGIANRRSGGYGLMRSAGLGYFYGGGENSVCKSLQSDLLGDDAFCDNDGAFFPLAMLNPINKNELGKTIRLGGEGSINPLMDRYVVCLN